MQLSHVLYRVNDLQLAVEKLRNAGFTVEYGTNQKQAHNALIWFEKGVFIEIFKNPKMPVVVRWLMKISGFRHVLQRMDHWTNINEGWCEWSLESPKPDLKTEKALLKSISEPFRSYKAKRTDIHKRKLSWELVIPDDTVFPFLMSAYTPDPRPAQILHANGATGVRKLVVGANGLKVGLLVQLLPASDHLQLMENKSGLYTVQLENTDLTIEAILS